MSQITWTETEDGDRYGIDAEGAHYFAPFDVSERTVCTLPDGRVGRAFTTPWAKDKARNARYTRQMAFDRVSRARNGWLSNPGALSLEYLEDLERHLHNFYVEVRETRIVMEHKQLDEEEN